jgi:hypothetical protein
MLIALYETLRDLRKTPYQDGDGQVIEAANNPH